MDKKPIRALFNATTINKGGGIQACVSIARHIAAMTYSRDGIEWIFSVSPEVRDELSSFGVSLRKNIDICVTPSPAKNKANRQMLREFARDNVDVVFTFFGPSYVKFDKPHLCGVADGWVTHSSRLAFSTLPTLREKLYMAGLCLYKAIWFRHATFWVVEQNVARNGLSKRLKIPQNLIHVVENNCSQSYLEKQKPKAYKRLNSPVRVLTLASYYPHKALELIPKIAWSARHIQNIEAIRFVLTIPQQLYKKSKIAKIAKELDVEDLIHNIGPIPLSEGPQLYEASDIVLLPSVLETFSATYPEAMHMGLPIITSDLSFARDICKSAALYFKPMSPYDAAEQLRILINSSETRKNLIDAGLKRSAEFPTPEERYAKYAFIIQSLAGSRLNDKSKM